MTRSAGFGWRVGIFVSGLAILVAGGARADWKVYVAADFGISTSETETNGSFDTGTGVFDLDGMDNDSSPLLGGAVGIAIPMNELLPREWLLDLRLPDWPVRFELEGAGLREYEFSTLGLNGTTFFTEVEVSTFFFNTWVDIPVLSAYQPIQYLFGLGRQPRLRQILEPMSFYAGLGIGFSHLDFEGTDNLVELEDDFLEFAWNAGVGINYQLTDRVALATGYRFVGVEEVGPDLGGSGVPAAQNAQLDFEQDIHEFRATIRVEVYDFLSPWR